MKICCICFTLLFGLVVVEADINADGYKTGVFHTTFKCGAEGPYKSLLNTNIYEKSTPDGLDVKVYLRLANLTKDCPVDDPLYTYAERFTLHDIPATVTRNTLIVFNVTNVSKDWTLIRNTASGLEPRKLADRLQCPADCMEIPEGASIIFERETISIEDTLKFMISVKLGTAAYNSKQIQIGKGLSPETIAVITVPSVIGLIALIIVFKYRKTICNCCCRESDESLIQREEQVANYDGQGAAVNIQTPDTENSLMDVNNLLYGNLNRH